MSYENIIRAWKDETFRNGLGETERSLLPAHPSGLVELTNADLSGVGGAVQRTFTTVDSVIATCNGCATKFNCQ
jgi:mersacidin/lichenicidin family type 2 lantibiotic